ncbi:MAG: endonuclease III [Hydrogenothermaceae bacterium]|nr:endonuclease III [Hydrogenothermaceae bacterium]
MVNFSEKEVVEGLKKHFPEPRIELDYKNLYQLLIVVILSAQTTDKRVNQVSPKLFEKYPSPRDLAKADIHELENILKPLGFYRRKALLIKECANSLVERFDRKVPDSIKELTMLPRVGRKTASTILVNTFNIPAIVVDTHVMRVVTKRLKISQRRTPEKVEEDLSRFFLKDNWIYISKALVLFGRYICTAYNPKCGECNLYYICSYKKKAR